jgi:hypothetical protein
MTSMKKESPMTSQPSQPKSNESLVLIVGAEGGGITLRGRETAGGWEFRIEYADQTPLMLDEPEIRRETGWTRDWSEVLAYLDRKGWRHLRPVMVAPEFRARVWEAISARLTTDGAVPAYRRDELLARWRDRCDIAT